MRLWHTLPEHLIANFIRVITILSQLGKLFLKQFISMGLLMLFKCLPVGNDHNITHILLNTLARASILSTNRTFV